MRDVCQRLVTVPRTDPSRARCASMPTPPATSSIRCRIRGQVPLAGLCRTHAGPAADRALRRRRLRLPVPLVNMPRQVACPTILFTHNVEAEIWRRHAETATNPIARQLLAQQWRRMLRFEREALARFDLVLAVSEADSDTFARLYPARCGRRCRSCRPASTRNLPSRSADAGAARASRLHRVDGLAPNEDGMLYFVHDILPLVRQAEPGTTLSTIGRAPTPAVRKLAEEPGVEITGSVDDVRPHVAAGSVYIVPLRIGGGTRLKIFEAMGMGKAVVSTTIGAEGLPVTDGADLVIADEPAAFAEAVVRLIRETRHAPASRAPHGGWSSSATTGRRSARTSRTRWRASPKGTARSFRWLTATTWRSPFFVGSI